MGHNTRARLYYSGPFFFFFLCFFLSYSPNVRDQSKSAIYNVYNYFKGLGANKLNRRIKDIFVQMQTTADGCIISHCIVQKIFSLVAGAFQLAFQFPLKSPKKKTLHFKPVMGIDDFNKNVCHSGK